VADKAPASALTIDTKKVGEVVVVHLHGRLVGDARDILYAEVHKLIPGSKRIVLDLGDLTHMDSMGLGTLARLYVSARSASCALELMNLSHGIRKLLVLTNMLSVFSVIGEHGIKMGP